MALQSSGQIKFSQLIAELNQAAGSEFSISTAAEGGYETINTNSTSTPNADTPHAISEWYSYDHSAAPAAQYYWDLSNDIKWDSATDKPVQSTSEDFSISLWIRPQWAATDLNLIIFDLTPSGTTSTANRLFLQYDYGLNRLITRYRSNSVNFDRQWALHENNSACGTGTSSANKWTSSNRGNVNGSNFIHLVLTYDASQSTGAAAFKIYWSGSELTNTTASNNGSRSNMTLDELTFCGNDHNTGGSRIADYMYMHMWDKLLTSSNVSSMYNSGTPISASDASLSTDLIFGDTSTSVPSANAADDSGNYDFLTANSQTLVQL
jgi:hypothetical protein